MLQSDSGYVVEVIGSLPRPPVDVQLQLTCEGVVLDRYGLSADDIVAIHQEADAMRSGITDASLTARSLAGEVQSREERAVHFRMRLVHMVRCDRTHRALCVCVGYRSQLVDCKGPYCCRMSASMLRALARCDATSHLKRAA